MDHGSMDMILYVYANAIQAKLHYTQLRLGGVRVSRPRPGYVIILVTGVKLYIHLQVRKQLCKKKRKKNRLTMTIFVSIFP